MSTPSQSILSKTNLDEVAYLKKQKKFESTRVVGTYVYGEIGCYCNKVDMGVGTSVALVIGDELQKS